MKMKLAFTLFMVSGFLNLFAQTSPNCLNRDCEKDAEFDCYVSKDMCKSCIKHLTPKTYYTDFTGSNGVFNTRDASTGCQEWSMLTSGNNCCDNVNFNCRQRCNTVNQDKYPYKSYPRMVVSNGGRLGGEDQCIQMNCYPGDNIQAAKKNSRAEITIRPTIVPGETAWFAWSFKLPQDLGYDQDAVSCPNNKHSHFIIAQLHQYTDSKKQKISTACSQFHAPPFILNLTRNKKGTGYAVHVRYGVDCKEGKNRMTQKTDGDQSEKKNFFPVEQGEWYDVVLGTTWSTSNADGKIDVSVYRGSDGQLVFQSLDNRQANLYPDTEGGWLPNVLQMGVYRGDDYCTRSSVMIDEFSTAPAKKDLHIQWGK